MSTRYRDGHLSRAGEGPSGTDQPCPHLGLGFQPQLGAQQHLLFKALGVGHLLWQSGLTDNAAKICWGFPMGEDWSRPWETWSPQRGVNPCEIQGLGWTRRDATGCGRQSKAWKPGQERQERGAISYSGGTFRAQGSTHVSCVSCIARQVLYTISATWGSPEPGHAPGSCNSKLASGPSGATWHSCSGTTSGSPGSALQVRVAPLGSCLSKFPVSQPHRTTSKRDPISSFPRSPLALHLIPSARKSKLPDPVAGGTGQECER